jgi:hypothetical protein
MTYSCAQDAPLSRSWPCCFGVGHTETHTHTGSFTHTHTHTHTQAQRNVVARMRPTLAAGPAVYARRKTNVKKIKAAM